MYPILYIHTFLGISSEKIEIDPITQKNTKLQFVKQLPMSHPMDSVAWCEETESRGNKLGFRVVYSSGFGGGSSGDRTNMYSDCKCCLISYLNINLV